MTVDHYTHDAPDWPIVVYQAIDGQIPFAPFVAYPLVPTVEKGGKRSVMVAVRCPGQTAEEASDAARAWIREEAEKNRAKLENIKAGAEKRRVTREGGAAC